MEPIGIETLRERHRGSGGAYLEFLREPSMSAGLYRISAANRTGRRHTPRTRCTS